MTLTEKEIVAIVVNVLVENEYQDNTNYTDIGEAVAREIFKREELTNKN